MILSPASLALRLARKIFVIWQGKIHAWFHRSKEVAEEEVEEEEDLLEAL